MECERICERGLRDSHVELPDGIAEACLQEPLFGSGATVLARMTAAGGRAPLRCAEPPTTGGKIAPSLGEAIAAAAAEALYP